MDPEGLTEYTLTGAAVSANLQASLRTSGGAPIAAEVMGEAVEVVQVVQGPEVCALWVEGGGGASACWAALPSRLQSSPYSSKRCAPRAADCGSYDR